MTRCKGWCVCRNFLIANIGWFFCLCSIAQSPDVKVFQQPPSWSRTALHPPGTWWRPTSWVRLCRKLNGGIMSPLLVTTPNSMLLSFHQYKTIHPLTLRIGALNSMEFPNNWLLSVSRSYLPTPPLGQDMTQGQFLSGVQQVWIQSFPSPRLVASPRLKNLVCPTIYP